MAISFVSYVNRVSIATAGDTRMMAQYEISPTRMGAVYSAFLFTYTLCMIPGGLFIDRLGPRAALLTVMLGSSVFVALTGVIGLTISGGATAFIVLLVVRGLMGIVSAPLYPACAAAVGRWVPAGSRSRANGLVNGSALIGVAITPLVFGAIIDLLDWPAAFLIAACVTLVLALVWYVFVGTASEQLQPGDGDTQGTDNQAGDHSPWWNLLKNRGLLLLTLSYGAVNYFQYLFFYWMNYYFQTVLELPESRSRAYAAIPPLAMAVGMPLGGWLTDRLEDAFGPRRGRKIMPMVGMLSGAGLLMLGVFARDPAWIVTWFALALGAVGTAEGAFWVTAIELGVQRGGSSAALLNTGGNAGGMLAPVLTPWIGQLCGWGYAVGLGAMISLLGVLFWLGIEIGESSVESRKDF
jgi:MFS transporter, ACS family, D-galactonate transporter